MSRKALRQYRRDHITGRHHKATGLASRAESPENYQRAVACHQRYRDDPHGRLERGRQRAAERAYRLARKLGEG